MKLTEEIDLEAFAKAFLETYLENGYTTMPKREIDLLVLRLLIEHRESWSWEEPPSAFALSQELRATRSKMRSMMDEISFRHLANEDTARKRLRKIITDRVREEGEELFENNKVRIQIEDGFLREFAKDLVQKDFGIVDSSFNSSILVLSGDKFLAIAFEVMPESAREKIETELNEHKEALHAQDNQNLVRLFFEHAVKGAGNEVGKQAINLGVTALTGGTDKLPGIVKWFIDKMKSDDSDSVSVEV
jgi:hypothetical protein